MDKYPTLIPKRKNRKKKRKSVSQANCLTQVSTRTAPAMDTDSKESLSYAVIQIESESHGCHMAGILGALKRKNRKKKRKSVSQANCLTQVSTRTTPAVDTDSKESLSYPVIQIESESHGCHMAGILGALVQPSTKVLGF
ncbi:hypothetical protein J6590_100322 [Homalodisca vitripennis]|nr:hypothetical protein J6590_100322 [Homalodisca vitripennis]